jgi:uncharacterized coiled-coil protein SlyX
LRSRRKREPFAKMAVTTVSSVPSRFENTATGSHALESNTAGELNMANGYQALATNTTGYGNTAAGSASLYRNTTGGRNTAAGLQALSLNTTGSNNVAAGDLALFSNTTGRYNTSLGSSALFFNTTGDSNIAIGESAGSNLTTGKNNINLGNSGNAGESAKIRIGNRAHKNTYIAGISGVTVANGVGVIIDTEGHLGTINSSKRFKDAIKPMGDASEPILALTPVTFRYKHELDLEGIPQFGLVAEEVEKVNPDLVARDEQGKPYTVRYEAVNAMLLNEFLKEHRTVQELKSTAAKQEATITQLKSTVAKQEASVVQQQRNFQAAIAQQEQEIRALTASLKEQASQLQRVSAKLAAASPSGGGLEMRSPQRAPQVVLNNQ